uniref:Uncharacterized protein n=1 Tax=Spumella elongata TaxID=89044 RepID=A0A7S3MHY4_9STRA|mmetsp:Transcript_74182/g.241227  ORF Transcript_74182/g.241227 Transcript_74182/m.241227 type:complete len:208 (+) Transcript_74182:122-745(+)|eukprot:CAMPEP_0203970242 /NCGR_PEP_ID=MMETSP0359-20131031/97867_1 /ASSEMBLY_ACC=CAM_ASM_000338 /TAXON_ID=268821 /ORGANISM="Scrippsiella Hangoei, Strain SHTV-5" /LENGTH=207 /DNA_ID=CAMNT_0050908193 /DNA_START=120 /DNA_END=743 /DNA_ORIENTATION=+
MDQLVHLKRGGKGCELLLRKCTILIEVSSAEPLASQSCRSEDSGSEDAPRAARLELSICRGCPMLKRELDPTLKFALGHNSITICIDDSKGQALQDGSIASSLTVRNGQDEQHSTSELCDANASIVVFVNDFEGAISHSPKQLSHSEGLGRTSIPASILTVPSPSDVDHLMQGAPELEWCHHASRICIRSEDCAACLCEGMEQPRVP